MWSVPVHRWLLACVHRPMLELTRGGKGSAEVALASSATPRGVGASGVAAVAGETGNDRNNGGDGGGDGDKKYDPPRSSPLSPRASPTLTSTQASSKKTWSWLAAVLPTFVVSGVFHEAVVYVAMRGTCWPFNTFLLCVAGLIITSWDYVFPIIRPAAANLESGSCDGSEVLGQQTKMEETSGGRVAAGAVKVVRACGDRGPLSVVVLNFAINSSIFICDCAAWLWWRYIHMNQ